MYHIKSDKRSIVSATMIYEGLKELLAQQNDINKITISDIQRVSSVSRATFYRLFDEVIDVLVWKCDCFHKKVFEECHNAMGCSYTKYTCIETYFNSWQKNVDIIETLLKIHRIDIVYYSFIDNYHIITDSYSSVDAFTKDPRLFSAFRSAIALTTMVHWIETGKTKTSEELLSYLIDELKFVAQSEVFF